MIASEPPTRSIGIDTPRHWLKLAKGKASGRNAAIMRGGAWSAAGYIATQLFRTLTTLFLAKLYLGPEMFGVVGLVTVFLSGLAMFSELGLVAAVVQHPRGDDTEFLDTAFSIQASRGV